MKKTKTKKRVTKSMTKLEWILLIICFILLVASFRNFNQSMQKTIKTPEQKENTNERHSRKIPPLHD